MKQPSPEQRGRRRWQCIAAVHGPAWRFLATLITTLLGMTTGLLAQPDLESAANAFVQGALRLQDSDARPISPIRWAQTIYYAPRNAGAAPRLERLAWDSVRRIASIAGVSVEETTSSDPRANFFVSLIDHEAPPTPGQAGARTCYLTSTWKNYRLTKAELHMNFNNLRRIDRCAVHEAVHGFGFLSHPHGADSILSYTYNRSDLTPLDRFLIETLYDRTIQPGMPRPLAIKVACGLLGQKLRTPAAQIEATCR